MPSRNKLFDKKTQKVLIPLIIAGIITLFIFAFVFVFFRSQNEQKPSVDESMTPEKVEEITKDHNSIVDVGGQDIKAGKFISAQGGNLTFQISGGNEEVPLTEDDVVISCSDQDLTDSSKLDFDQITKVNIFRPDEIGDKLKSGESIVVFTADVNGTRRAHTIVVPNSLCPDIL